MQEGHLGSDITGEMNRWLHQSKGVGLRVLLKCVQCWEMKKITDFYTKKSGKFVVPFNKKSNLILLHWLFSTVNRLDILCNLQTKYIFQRAAILLHLLPSIIVNNTLELSEATESMLFWENDLPFPKSLGNELKRWQTMWQSAEKELPNNLLLALGACDEDTFPNIHRLLLIACTLPISSAEAERSFSLMKRIKTCTRSTMSEQRFSDLAVIAMLFPERFEVDEICETFVKAHPRRLFQATLFDWGTLRYK